MLIDLNDFVEDKLPIFKIAGKKIEKIKASQFSGSEKEKQLQSLIESNLDTIFDMTFVFSEFSTSHGGMIDTLAIDTDKRPVIIEYKADKSATILLQGLYYMDWLVENKAEFEKVVRSQLAKEIPINWNSGIRLVLIARSFEIWDKFAVNRIKEEVELYEYTLYENHEIKLDKTTLPKDFRGHIKTSITSNPEYSIEDQLKYIQIESVKTCVNDLREKIHAISDDIDERPTKNCINFKSTVNFFAIHIKREHFWVLVKLPRKEVKISFPDLDVRLRKDVIFTHIRCKENTDIDQLVSLAQQAYENTL
jgi:RecB family endonuclease NucS